MPSTESYQLLLAAAAACEDKKAEDIRILALDPSESGLTDYFLICNGTNERQNVAITDEIEIRLKREFGVYPNSVEGRRQGEWILMDYVDFIVHVFSAEKRAYYGLERMRKSATTISVAELNAELKAKIAAARSKASGSKTVKKSVKTTATKTAAKSEAAPVKKVAKKAAKVVAETAPKKAAKPAVKKAVKSVAKKVAVKKTAKPAVKATAKKAVAPAKKKAVAKKK
ncbi:MAG: ribosome silencing factor [Acidobacteriaceae bacterium]|nr:ribosome silencing factor [Acidobacteriaceae bacterium]